MSKQVKRINCEIKEESCKDCICQICTNEKCYKVFCNTELKKGDIYKNCDGFIDWIKILFLSEEDIKQIKIKRTYTIDLINRLEIFSLIHVDYEDKMFVKIAKDNESI